MSKEDTLASKAKADNSVIHFLISLGLPLVILVGGLFATFWVADKSKELVLEQAQVTFESNVEQIQNAIQNRMQAYTQVLLGGKALFQSSEEVTRAEWESYFAALKIDDRYPGIQGFGWSIEVGDENAVVQHEKAIQAQGFPDYSVRPKNPREEYHSIIYLEPFDERNQAAFGYDMFSEATRRTAMTLARDTGEPSVSGKITLVQEIDEDVQAGFLIYVPHYVNGTINETIEQRRTNFLGFVYSPFRMGNFMKGLLEDTNSIDIDIQIYNDEELTGDSLMYEAVRDPNYTSFFSDVIPMQFRGTTWYLLASDNALFDIDANIYANYFTIATGSAISFMLALLVFLFGYSERKAVSISRKLTQNLMRSEERFKSAFQSSPIGIALVSLEYKITRVNPAMAEIFDTTIDELVGTKLSDLLSKNDMSNLKKKGELMKKNKENAFEETVQVILKDKGVTWINQNVAVVRDEKDKPLYFLLQIQDITKSKKDQEEIERRTVELEEINSTMVGRELRMSEIKEEMKLLQEQLDNKKE